MGTLLRCDFHNFRLGILGLLSTDDAYKFCIHCKSMWSILQYTSSNFFFPVGFHYDDRALISTKLGWFLSTFCKSMARCLWYWSKFNQWRQILSFLATVKWCVNIFSNSSMTLSSFVVLLCSHHLQYLHVQLLDKSYSQHFELPVLLETDGRNKFTKMERCTNWTAYDIIKINRVFAT